MACMIFYSLKIVSLVLLSLLADLKVIHVHGGDTFDDNYLPKWGADHVIRNSPDQISLRMDQTSGSGFWSKEQYGSGFFEMRMKPPKGNSAGVVSTFYLMSDDEDRKVHDEIDFEFLGDVEGKLITLQTNVYANGEGNREQRFRLWFDPTEDFHFYSILWNHHQILFFVDSEPIRVFKNNKKIHVGYPTKAMRVEGSIWNGESWASHGLKVNWSCAPFDAVYDYFHIDGCPAHLKNCYSQDPKYFWNDPELYWSLTPEQWETINRIKTHWMNYDYCQDRKLWPTPPPECATL
ncbi:hypothetical protein Dimus_036896 [Dionaea muscipula]